MINFKQIFAPQRPDGSYEDAARRQAYAEALQRQAMQQRGPAPGGPVQAQYGIGEGLTQLAQALLARRAGKSAIDAKKAADTKQTATNDQNINAMLPATEMQSRRYDPTGEKAPARMGTIENMQADALSQALRGQDPQQVGQFLAQRQMQTLLPDPAEVADREFKMYQVASTMSDKADARQQRLMELQMQLDSRALDREQQAAAAAEMAALRRDIAMGQQQTQRDIAAMGAQRESDARTAEATAKAAPKEAGKQQLDDVALTLGSYYDELDKSGGIVSNERGAVDNLQASVASSGVGQAFGRAIGTKNQTARDSIKQTRPILLQAIKNATGMSAQQMNSNVELMLWIEAATDPAISIESNRAALANIKKWMGSGTSADLGAPPAGGAPAAGGVPAGVPPELWQNMTPEERALWQN
jgi:hypothetical protein